ncbi:MULTISPECIES: HIT domain-containing protein [Sphingomonas]|jgi:diadenosine tetraphosphate (Ap4A) HIT family hydrolase|uniref:HIT domain-containing protein n=1 Tax=Sphingomonas ginsenosidimutans TaxID=862134 RepID=A0A2A4I1U4_9SPHN|nr:MULTISPECIES: HIT domain-containing protein [Sphingomonas]MBY0303022.1 HIT domain-containing protein [Sphingomonas ginsenosidimutans]PCG10584.1 HIT domain-containing protein [Sphingomonas ginsenosidimutans]
MSVDATQPYDDGNIFARLLRGEIPSRRVYEDEHVVVFHDIAPWAPTHLLAVPRGRYVSWDDFSANASDAEIAAFTRAIGKVARDAGLVETGYRLIANAGRDSHQEVPHLHVHIMAGRPLGPMLVENDGRK